MPKVGDFQWRIADYVYGYTQTKEEAVQLAVKKCLKDATFYMYPRPWFVGQVIRVLVTYPKDGYRGLTRRTTVVTSTVAFGHGTHSDELREPTIPTAVIRTAQGRSRA